MIKRNFNLFARIFLFSLGIYAAGAYFLLPDLWKHYEHHKELEAYPKVSFTAEGLSGDPLNAGLTASEKELIQAMKLAGWMLADTLGLSSDFKIAESVLLKQSYSGAPVSKLFLFGRPQDLAFEKQVGGNPRQRHHVRFWKTEITEREGRFLWIGSATFDRSVGFSRTTGQLTHHIAADVDKERDELFRDLARAGQLMKIYQVSGVGPSLISKNGGGDRYFTDGELTVGLIPEQNKNTPVPAKEINPIHIEIKNRSWEFLKTLMRPDLVSEESSGKENFS